MPEKQKPRHLQTPGEQESRKRETQRKLIWFFLCMLGAILLSEILINSLMNRRILPSIQAFFLPYGSLDFSLSNIQLAFLLTGLCLLLLLQACTFLFPLASPLVRPLQEWLNNQLRLHVPQITSASPLQELRGGNGLLLLLIALGLILLELLPFLIFGTLYIRFVIRQTERVAQEDRIWYQEFDENRNRMLADIAHDIRNPMSTIAGYAQALEEGMITDPEKQKEYLAAIRRKSERVNSLIRVLFEYTKLHSSGFSLEKQAVDLCELLRKIVAELYADAEDRGLEFILKLPDQPLSVSVDPVQLTRAVSNLINNAIRYNPAGTRILIALQTGGSDGAGDTRIVIADTGAAIPEDTAARIFEPFSRGDTSRPTDGGSGLGLAITDSIIRMHGWELSLDTAIPKYTKGFVIRIP